MIFSDSEKKKIITAIEEAANAIIHIYEQPIEVTNKEDQSPLTKADIASNQLLNNHLSSWFPSIPIISEENKATDYYIRKNYEYCWLIDPLDGTKEFIKRNGEFTINVALIKQGTPILGIIAHPISKTIWHNMNGYVEKKEGDECVKLTPLNTELNKASVINIIASRSHINIETSKLIKRIEEKGYSTNRINAGSALKFSLICENKAHMYPRLAPTMEWDTAAGQSLINSFGGVVLNIATQKPMTYNKENLLNDHFIAFHPALQHIAEELM